MAQDQAGQQGQRAGGFLGSLKEALAAASREDTANLVAKAALPQPAGALPPPATAASEPERKAPIGLPPPMPATTTETVRVEAVPGLSAADAAKASRGVITLRHSDADGPPTTRVVRASAKPVDDAPRTKLVRGRPRLERSEFQQDPVVGWLVVVGGPGLGSFRPIYEGNNTLGRSPTQRIPIDFGDDSISSEEQAYIRYDSSDRSFLFVPNLAKTNVVSINDRRPTGAVELSQMDVITVGRTQLVFVPFCGPEFDWSELADSKE